MTQTNQRAVSLEELEARCEMLQRRVVDRASVPPQSNSRMKSPARVVHSGVPSDPQPTAQMASSTEFYAQPSPKRVLYGGIPNRQVGQLSSASAPSSDSQLTTHSIAFAVSSLEREKFRLEEQLKLVNLHLAAYRALQGTQKEMFSGSLPPQQFLNKQQQQLPIESTSNHVQTENYPSRAETPGNYGTEQPLSSPPPNAIHYQSAEPHQQQALHSHAIAEGIAQQHTTTTYHTDQIYEELNLIRRAREERAEQRRRQQQQQQQPQYYAQTPQQLR